MFSFIKRKQKNTSTEKTVASPETVLKETLKNTENSLPDGAISPETAQLTSQKTKQASETDVSPAKLSESLEKTRHSLVDGMADFFLGKKSIDQNLFDELEMKLLSADVGIDATTTIIDELQNTIARKAINSAEALQLHLKQIMTSILQPCQRPLDINNHQPFVILVVGINGAGKTTSIGKLARHFLKQNKSVMLAAGDTFRAAAVEQLQQWGERNNVPVVAQGTGADPASVVFDALQSAKAKNIDVLIADTAGRLHTQTNLMDELAKIKRVLGKLEVAAPHETLIVMDAGFGQNALHQVEQFHRSIGLTGIAVTKLDGTAKGGILFSIAKTLNLPVRFIGTGEGIDDFQAFDAEKFVGALLE